MIEITESAARVITRQLEKRHQPQGGLRIAVKAGGCSGFSYTFAWDETAREADLVFEGAGGAKVFVDPRSLKLLDGTVLDSRAVSVQSPGDDRWWARPLSVLALVALRYRASTET